MREDQLLQQAISAARAGRELTARDIFLEIIEANPRNEVAWMWLTGLLDELDDCIYACEQVLKLNPLNDPIRDYLSQLLEKKQTRIDSEKSLLEGRVQQARQLAAAGRDQEALELLRSLMNAGPVGAEAWRLLARLSPDLNEQILATQKLLEFKPGDSHLGQELERLRHFQQNPLELAAMYEEQGKLNEAISAYGQAAVTARTRGEWDSLYWKMARLENLRQENIAHISPVISVARLTAGPPLLYLLLMAVQLGLNPFAETAGILWIGFLFVLLGGFMTALASVRSRHRLWVILFKDVGAGGSQSARTLLALTGWFLILLPHLLLVVLAYDRLVRFTVGLLPW